MNQCNGQRSQDKIQLSLNLILVKLMIELVVYSCSKLCTMLEMFDSFIQMVRIFFKDASTSVNINN